MDVITSPLQKTLHPSANLTGHARTQQNNLRKVHKNVSSCNSCINQFNEQQTGKGANKAFFFLSGGVKQPSS